MVDIKQLIPLSVAMLSVVTIAPTQAATFIPGQQSSPNPNSPPPFLGNGSASQVLDITIGDDQYNVTFVQGTFNQIWGNLINPINVITGRPPAFWNAPAGGATAFDAIEAINAFFNSLTPVPTRLVGRAVDPTLIGLGLRFISATSFAIPQGIDPNNPGHLLFQTGVFNGGNWINPTGTQSDTTPSTTPQNYAIFQVITPPPVSVPEPSNLVGLLVGGASLLLIGANKPWNHL